MQKSETLQSLPYIATELWRRMTSRVRTLPFIPIRLGNSVPDEWGVSPPDFRTVDPVLADRFYAGHYQFCGIEEDTGGESPFAARPPSAEWQQQLHGFRWLRHLRATDTQLARSHGAALLLDWVALCDPRDQRHLWTADMLATRLIAWCAHAPKFLSDSVPDEQVRALRHSMMRQARLLQTQMSVLPVNEKRLHAAMALVHVAIALPGPEKILKQAMRELERELERQVMSDGGSISRNPSVLVDLLTDLSPLRHAFHEAGTTLNPGIPTAIDRIAAALKFFRHSNDQLASFNGTRQRSPELIDTLLESSLDENAGKRPTQSSLPRTGYERLAFGKTVVLQDTGKPLAHQASQSALAGCLSFELSHGKQIFIQNCGVPEAGHDAILPFARASAAHTTAIISDTSSSRFVTSAKLLKFLPCALLQAPETVTCERRTIDGYDEINASHDGYAPQFGIVHRRILQLSEDGDILNGADRFEDLAPHKAIGDGEAITLRFHIAPGVSASILSNGHSILLAASDRDAWTFSCIDAPIELAESMHFASPGGPRKTEQIVVQGHTRRNSEIRWAFVRRAKAQTQRRTKKAKAGPDLLSVLDEDVQPNSDT